MENVLITNQKRFEELKDKFKKAGLEKLHVLADFDKTLTKVFVHGKKIASLISILRDNDYLTPGYPKKSKALYAKYFPIEKNLGIPEKERKQAMKQWWTEHFELLMQSKLNIKDIEKAVEHQDLVLRKGTEELLKKLKEERVPLVVLSSSGLGKEGIELYLDKKQLLFDNIHIISNSFEWNKQGYATAVKAPIIHGMNKNETAIKKFPEIFEKIKNRKNVIILGDNVSDIKMIAGFDYDNLIKIGFLNEDIEENLENYKQAFDVLILEDSSIEFLNNFLKDIS
ncbi:hypothetical protein AMJ47_03620 [Parcubacteria bacterium DG_72]|nr:MAG: hypothetical protein AMJ47_03620 [Parcubacteria bacterium DG_72]